MKSCTNLFISYNKISITQTTPMKLGRKFYYNKEEVYHKDRETSLHDQEYGMTVSTRLLSAEENRK